ncbi:MAG: hypothetical protein HYX66_06645 [Ignavibacteria bacterium]|nr:hypothetical protein [Ignavibacteria bacterium]
MKWIRGLVASIVFSGICSATPQLSLLTGNRCSNCHVAFSGGATRNQLGWYSMYDVSIIPRDSDILSWLYPSDSTNDISKKQFIYGWDFRIQSTKSFTDENASRVIFPMQAAVYAAYQPVKAFTIEGSYNIASLRQAPNSDQQIRFPGQRAGWLSTIIQPGRMLPALRAGLFRPSIGIRYDDHTIYTYNYVLPLSRQVIIAPNWAEYGAEVSYEGLTWLTAEMGIFGSGGLSQVPLWDGVAFRSAITGNAPTVTARLVAWPKISEGLSAGYVGGSYLFNNDFSMLNAFVGIGLTDYLSLIAETVFTSKTDVMKSTTFMTELLWQLWSPVLAYVRYETGTTNFVNTANSSTINSLIFGSQLFVLPFVEFRPEYRIQDTYLDGYSSRWNFQLHIFY